MIVSNLLSVTQAAEFLHISQPALSRKIQHLEQRIGAQLFIRAHNRIYLTPAGRSFKDDAVQILIVTRAARARMQNSNPRIG